MTATGLSGSEVGALEEFQSFLMTPQQMLCFSGPGLEKHGAALEALSKKELLHREKPPGAYSLTSAGYVAMKRIGQANAPA